MSTPSQILSQLGAKPFKSVEAKMRKAVETISTVKFAWHCWPEALPNRGSNGSKMGIHYGRFESRMLIPLPTFPNPKFRPRQSGMAFFPSPTGEPIISSSVGSTFDTVDQLPSKSATNLLKAWGEHGIAILESLTCQDEIGRSEAYLLYEALMRTPIESGFKTFRDEEELKELGLLTESGLLLRGDDIVIEHLPKFLDLLAPELLRRAGKDGVMVGSERVILKSAAIRKGEKLTIELRDGIQRSVRKALAPESGVLTITKKQLEAATHNVAGSKAILDDLDRMLLRQFPSFNLDNEVQSVVRALSGAVSSPSAHSDRQTEILASVVESQNATAETQKATLELLAEMKEKKSK